MITRVAEKQPDGSTKHYNAKSTKDQMEMVRKGGQSNIQSTFSVGNSGPLEKPLPGGKLPVGKVNIGKIDDKASGALRKTGRPLVLVFFPLTGKYKQDKEDKTYRAEPVHFAGLKDVALRYADKADFAAISSSKDDAPADVAALWRRRPCRFLATATGSKSWPPR